MYFTLKQENQRKKGKDILESYYKRLKEYSAKGLYPTKYTILMEVINEPAPCWYTTVESAMKKLLEYQKMGKITASNRLKYQKWTDLINLYLRLESQYCATLNRKDIMEIAVNSPAPKYYITERSARLILSQALLNG